MLNKTRFITLILFCLFVSVHAQDNEIKTEGIGFGSNETEALMAAKRDAVEKGIGTILMSRTEIENFQLKRDQIITKTLGSVKSYEKISQTKEQDGLIKIKIAAVLSKSMMHEDLAAFHILLETMEKPKVMVIVNENNIGNQEPSNRAAENSIIGFLKKPYDFDIIDPGIVKSIRTSEEKMAKITGDPAEAASIASGFGAEVIITGTAISRTAENISINLGGMKSVQADITLRAINCSTGRIIGTSDAHGAKVHISPNTAGTQAISHASKKAAEGLLDAIIEDWNDQINNGIPLVISIKNVTSFNKKNLVVQALQKVPGVAAVRGRNWNGESGILQADIQYKGNADGFCSKVDGYKLQRSGSLRVNGINGTRVSIIVQAN